MTSEIVDILDGRTKKVWSGYTQIIDKKELRRVRYVSIDMHEPYRSIMLSVTLIDKEKLKNNQIKCKRHYK